MPSLDGQLYDLVLMVPTASEAVPGAAIIGRAETLHMNNI